MDKRIKKEDLELFNNIMGEKKSKEPLKYKTGKKSLKESLENNNLNKQDNSKLLSFIEKTLTNDILKKFKKLDRETNKVYDNSIEQMERFLD